MGDLFVRPAASFFMPWIAARLIGGHLVVPSSLRLQKPLFYTKKKRHLRWTRCRPFLVKVLSKSNPNQHKCQNKGVCLQVPFLLKFWSPVGEACMWFGHEIVTSPIVCRPAAYRITLGNGFGRHLSSPGLLLGLSAALEAPTHILWDPFRALILGHRRSECEGTNSARALSPGDPGYMLRAALIPSRSCLKTYLT